MSPYKTFIKSLIMIRDFYTANKIGGPSQSQIDDWNKTLTVQHFILLCSLLMVFYYFACLYSFQRLSSSLFGNGFTKDLNELLHPYYAQRENDFNISLYKTILTSLNWMGAVFGDVTSMWKKLHPSKSQMTGTKHFQHWISYSFITI